jgi:heme/copper-type cytochrome/quinol oxidase subunit 2
VQRATLLAGVALLAAIPVGGAGAWAFNPDSGAVLHSEILWRIFGIMCEGGAVLLIVFLLVTGLVFLVRNSPATGRSGQP